MDGGDRRPAGEAGRLDPIALLRAALEQVDDASEEMAASLVSAAQPGGDRAVRLREAFEEAVDE